MSDLEVQPTSEVQARLVSLSESDTVSDEVMVGLTAMAETGISLVGLERLATLQLNAGGKCVGTLVEFLGKEDHARVRDGVIETITTAQQSGKDIEGILEDVVSDIGKRNVERDEAGKFKHDENLQSLFRQRETDRTPNDFLK